MTAGVPGRYDELSMGMSGDFELAIAYGATTVRVGEAIFGPRRTADRHEVAAPRRPAAVSRLSIGIGGTSSAGVKPKTRPRK